MASQIARRLIVLGAPGSGKGTIASRIVKTYGMPYIVVGDLLRQQIQQRTGETLPLVVPIGIDFLVWLMIDDSKTIKDHIDKGLLLPDDLVLKFVVDESEKNRDRGFLIDGKSECHAEYYWWTLFALLGYPRTLNQAELLHRQMKIDHVIALNVPTDEIISRLKDRWVHLPSGRVYNLLWSPPKEPVTYFPLSFDDDALLTSSSPRVKMTRLANRCFNEKMINPP